MSQETQTVGSQLLAKWEESEKKYLRLRLEFAKIVVRIPKNRKNIPELLKKIEDETVAFEKEYSEYKDKIKFL